MFPTLRYGVHYLHLESISFLESGLASPARNIKQTTTNKNKTVIGGALPRAAARGPARRKHQHQRAPSKFQEGRNKGDGFQVLEPRALGKHRIHKSGGGKHAVKCPGWLAKGLPSCHNSNSRHLSRRGAVATAVGFCRRGSLAATLQPH